MRAITLWPFVLYKTSLANSNLEEFICAQAHEHMHWWEIKDFKPIPLNYLWYVKYITLGAKIWIKVLLSERRLMRMDEHPMEKGGYEIEYECQEEIKA